ncbi:hypothetical protein ACJJIF_02590 [Microbulbifer sp. SSSA002]|uniref:hypothetical protein n=1 Tax=unclassified Microbulbifer TaxID=2619833 RepID=UPI00403A2B5A
MSYKVSSLCCVAALFVALFEPAHASYKNFRIQLCMQNKTNETAYFDFKNKGREESYYGWVHVYGRGNTRFTIPPNTSNCEHSIHVYDPPSGHADFTFAIKNESKFSHDPIYFKTGEYYAGIKVGRAETTFSTQRLGNYKVTTEFGRYPYFIPAVKGNYIGIKQQINITLEKDD